VTSKQWAQECGDVMYLMLCIQEAEEAAELIRLEMDG
jgi:hypothetical protein